MNATIYTLLAIAALGSVDTTAAPDRLYTWGEALAAIRLVETGGTANEGRGAIGDGGRAIGPFQIHRVYHIDAAERDRTLVEYSDCLYGSAYSKRVVESYMTRYARAETERLLEGRGTLADVERIARIHNGGPRGDRKSSTVRYWRKVRQELNRGV